MKKVFIEAKSRKEAISEAPWACKFVKVFGGYMAFQSIDDYNVWRNQK